MKVKKVPTLKEFLGDVVWMQRKYVRNSAGHKSKGLGGLRFTVVLKKGDASWRATEKDVNAALASAAEQVKGSNPRLKSVDAVIYVHLNGCSFKNSVPCALGSKIVARARKAFGLEVGYPC